MTELDPDVRRSVAMAQFNRVWELLDVIDRDDATVDELIGAAHTSRHLWAGIGSPQHQAVGEWQVSRVYAELGRGEPALFHAGRAVTWAEQAEETWVLASALEGLARALLVAGRTDEAAACADRARERLREVTDDEDREVVRADLDSLRL